MSIPTRALVLPALLLTLPALVGCSAGASASGVPITEVVSFGDSWSDAGTRGFVFGTSEGGAWTQVLAEEYGDTQEGDRLVADDGTTTDIGGLDYAEGGAFVAPIGDSGTEPRPMTLQLEVFLEEHGSFDPDQLVTVWAGSNDITAYLGAGDAERAERLATGDIPADELAQATRDVEGAARAEADLVQDIIDAGARHVVVLDMIDLGVAGSDLDLDDDGVEVLSAASDTFNDALRDALPKSPEVALFDMSGLLRDVQADPASFGFDVVEGDACSNGSYSCGPDAWATPDADREYVFAGLGHFTRGTRELIAARVHDLVTTTWE